MSELVNAGTNANQLLNVALEPGWPRQQCTCMDGAVGHHARVLNMQGKLAARSSNSA
jgi:hypothetical protein